MFKITGGIKMSGMSTSLVNGVAGGLSGGITTGDWKGSMVDSMRNSAAGYLGGNLGGGNDALTNASSMLFRKMLGSKEDFSWDTVAQNDAIGKLVGGYLNEMLMSDEQKNARAADEQKRQQEQGSTAQGFKFMNMFENTIGGFFSRLGDDMNALASDVGNAASGVKSAWGSIQSGEAWENIKTGAASAWEGVKGAASWVKDTAASAWNGVKNVAASAWNSVAGAVSTAVGAVGTLTQSAKNWFTGDGFNTDGEVAEIQARQRIQDAIKNGSALEEGSEEYKRIMSELYGNPAVKVGNSGVRDSSQSEEIRKLKEMDRILNGGGMSEGANSKAVEDIMAKIRDGKTVDASDLEKLTLTMMQKGSLQEEVLNSILNDKESFEKLNGKTFDFGENGKVTLDLSNPESIKAYAENISNVYCVAASLYGQMVVNGIGGTPGSFGEFTKQLLEKGLIDPSKPARQIESTQNIIDAFAGKGNYQVVGYGVDAGGGYFNDENGASTASYKGNILDVLIDTASANQNINVFNARINSPHNMNLFNDNGNLSIYDTSRRGFNASVTDNITKRNLRSWYYIRPVRRR